jgi:DNA-binding CsgD family transcriptional regulator/tetratricopeptide (TPR) repeat protein
VPTGLLERQDHLGVLLDAVAAARSGGGRVVVLSGEPGIGKTTLVRALRAALDPDVRVLAGACDDLLAPRPLGPLRDAARGTDGPLERALAAPGAPDAVYPAVLAQLAGPRPTLLVVEDVHWADDATLDVLRFLVRRIAELPALLLLTLRDEAAVAGHPAQQLLGALTGVPATRLALAPLSAASVTALARSAGRDGPALYAVTGGNPFYVTEALEAPPDRLPASVTDAVLARVRSLGPDAVRALEQLSVVPTRVDTALAEALLGDRVADLVTAEQRGIVEVRADGVAFRHELARRAVEASVPRLRRRGYHRAVLAALPPDAGPERVVHHAVEADDAATVVAFAPAAGRAAARAGSHRQALAHFSAAVPHLDRLDPAEQARLLGDHAWELHIGHRFPESVAAGREAVALSERLGDPVALGEARVRLSRLLFMAGETDEAQRQVELAVRGLGGAGSRTALAAASTDHGALLVLTGQVRAAVEPLRRARALAAEVGRPDLESLCLNYLGLALAVDDPVQGTAVLREGLEIAVAHGHHEPAARALVNLGELLYSEGDWAGFAANVERGRTYVAEHGLGKDVFLLGLHHCLLLVRRGDWDGADAALRDLRRDVEESMVDAAILASHGRLMARRGDDRAGPVLRSAWDRALSKRLPLAATHAGRALAEWAWLTGERDTAAEVAAALLPRMEARGWAHLRGELLRYLARAGLPAEPFDDCPEGWAAGLRGDWRAAARIWEQAGDHYEQALELIGSGVVGPALEGLRILDGLGAHAPAALARRRLRELGATRVPRGPHAATRANPAGLTDRQLDVLELVEAGATNAEIAEQLVLSVRTVDHHVSAILARLGAASRREAAATARSWRAPR